MSYSAPCTCTCTCTCTNTNTNTQHTHRIPLTRIEVPAEERIERWAMEVNALEQKYLGLQEQGTASVGKS